MCRKRLFMHRVVAFACHAFVYGFGLTSLKIDPIHADEFNLTEVLRSPRFPSANDGRIWVRQRIDSRADLEFDYGLFDEQLG